MVIYRTLLSPLELKNLYPLGLAQKVFVENSRKEICRILEGSDRRRLLIVGPCSIHDFKAAKEYALQLKKLSQEVNDQFLLVMRTYFEKPRTVFGWKGFLHDPGLDNSNNIEKGLLLTRELLLELLYLEVPTAAEFLEPASSLYFEDLISWGCIGARTSSSQTHRQMASGLSMPIAFKNTTDGNIEVATHGIISSSHAHVYIGMDPKGFASAIQTKGNRFGHLVLRGSDSRTNYDPDSVAHALQLLAKMECPLRLLIDCSHGNSNRNYERQSLVFQSVIGQIIEGNHEIRGMLVESHLNAGNQQIGSHPELLKYAVSLTDPCLDWEATEKLILWAHQKIKNENSLKSSSNSAIHRDNFALQRSC